MPINPLEGIQNQSSSSIPQLQQSQLSPVNQPQVAQNAVQGILPTIVEQLPPSKIQVPITNGLERPVFDAPDPSIKYPVINVPTQEEFDAAVRAEKQKEQQEKEEKERKLPDSPPPVIPAINAVQPQDKSESTTQPTTDKPVTAEIQVPILGAVPVPTNKEVALAGTTAMAATAAALLGKSAVDFLLKFFKPIANQFWIRSKKLLSKDLTEYEIQTFFAFETEAKLKKVSKLLKKEQRMEKIRQYKQSKGKK